MTDTPRTDKFLISEQWFIHSAESPDSLGIVDCEFARELEREVNKANDTIKRLEDAGDALAKNPNPFTFIDWEKAKEVR